MFVKENDRECGLKRFIGFKSRLKMPLILLMLIFGAVSHAFSPYESITESIKAPKTNQPGALNMGLMQLSHYNTDFQQTFYSLDYKNRSQTRFGKLNIDAFGMLKIQGEGSSTYSLREMYLEKSINSKTSFSLGRKIVNWVDLEEYLPAGFINNAWDFNKSLPQREGLVGAFLEHSFSKNLKVELMASPVSIPKATEHYKFTDDGSVEAQTLWFNPPPSSVNYDGGEYRAKYFLDLDIPSLISAPQIAGSLKWSGDSFFFNALYFYGPSKDVDMAIDFSLDISTPENEVGVFVDPSRFNVHKGVLEVGRKWSKTSRTILHASFLQRESGLSIDPSSRLSSIGTGSGAVYQVAHEETFLKGQLNTRLHFIENTEIQNEATGELDDFLRKSLLVSFRYRRGFGLDLSYLMGPRASVSLSSYYDSLLDGAMGRIAYEHRFEKALVSVGYNYIEALSADSSEFYRDFRQNDSLNLGVSYVF
jgi:hypothetical protein